uniref:Uncharacterized protein n=1 Tax=viral metagenome TaxID=1070528 RepID=A0A6M3JXI2_9ZZZZ
MGEVTYTVEKDGAISVKEEGSTEAVRYVKESDLLAVKGGKETAESKAQEAEAARGTAESALAVEHQKVLQAEAKVSTLESQVAQGTSTAAELATAKAELVTAKSSSETLATQHLELRRNVIVATYNVPKETVESKNLEQLATFEEALKAVIGSKNAGNFAVGGGGGGATVLAGKSPMELAQIAYSQPISK